DGILSRCRGKGRAKPWSEQARIPSSRRDVIGEAARRAHAAILRTVVPWRSAQKIGGGGGKASAMRFTPSGMKRDHHLWFRARRGVPLTFVWGAWTQK